MSTTAAAVAIAAIYLVHLNPMTNAHQSIISRLKKDYRVYIFPVRFIKDGQEVNTKSLPFSYQLRKQMVESVFGDSVSVLPDYAFYAPYSKYMPPLLSSRSWELRNHIITQINEEKFVSYTGDKAEQLMLKAYRLNPLKADRLEVSASSIRAKLYRQVVEGDRDEEWRTKVPEAVAEIIKKNWSIVDKFARMEDKTTRVMGMKFPKEGYNK
jgi:nicotinic acid mononucleotide adenylyltransferase